MEFTGNYYKCNECNHIWDFMGICPNCGKDNQTDLNAKEVREIARKMFDEQDRLKMMLETHGERIVLMHHNVLCKTRNYD